MDGCGADAPARDRGAGVSLDLLVWGQPPRLSGRAQLASLADPNQILVARAPSPAYQVVLAKTEEVDIARRLNFV